MIDKKILNEAYKDANKQIRALERKQESQNVNHILHLLISVFTAGIWIPIWILIVMSNTNVGSLDRKLEKLYSVRDEIELEMEGKLI